MNPHTHFLFPFVLGLLFTKLGFFSWELALLAGIIGAFVDMDHYIEHILHSKKNRFSLKSTWNNSMKYHTFRQRSFIHDTNGAIILGFLFIILSFFWWQIALSFALGYYSHLLLDKIHLRKKQFLGWKNLHLYMHISYEEFLLDILLVIFLGSYLLI